MDRPVHGHSASIHSMNTKLNTLFTHEWFTKSRLKSELALLFLSSNINDLKQFFSI